MKVRTLIVDDMRLARNRLARQLEQDPDVELIGECAGGNEAIAAIREMRPDLVFLDVQMPEIGGFDVIEALGADAVPVVVFVTAYDQFAIRAFEVSAVDYLLKPFETARLQEALDRAKRQLRSRERDGVDARLSALLESLSARASNTNRLSLKVDGRTVFLPAQEVDFIEAAGNYIRIQAGGESFMVRERLTVIETRLDTSTFARIHRSTIVNVTRIKEMHPLFNGDQSLLLKNGKRLTLSRTYRDALMARMEGRRPTPG
jgi:two-component system LytT family response regulator